MNRREMLGASLIPFVGSSYPATGGLIESKEIDDKKKQLCKLIKEIYGLEVDATVAGNIRLWKLGHIGLTMETTVLPTKSGIDKLRKIIEQAPDDGKFNVIWGPELDVKVI